MAFQHKTDLSKFWVVTCITNPIRFSSRYALYNRFKTVLEQKGINLITVEGAFGDRPFEITQPNVAHNLQVRLKDELWHKENLINLGISRLPNDWQYVAWVDADIEFMRSDWAEETVQQLQHYSIVQMFQSAIDLGPNGEALTTFNSFGWNFVNNTLPPTPLIYYPVAHPGFSWAANRDAIDSLGGLVDIGILGSGDAHMAWAFAGKVDHSVIAAASPAYMRHLKVWQDRCTKHIRKDVGYVPGTLFHHWHGKKKDRKYNERWKIITKHNYDPDQDLQRDWQGVYCLSDVGLRMRNDLRAYFRARSEDSIDL